MLGGTAPLQDPLCPPHTQHPQHKSMVRRSPGFIYVIDCASL